MPIVSKMKLEISQPSNGKAARGAAARTATTLAITLLLFSAQHTQAQDRSKYLPPLTPQTDQSVLEPAVKPGSADVGDRSQAQAAPMEPDDKVTGLLKEAIIKYRDGDVSGAERLFRQAIAIDPANVDANYNLGSIAEERRDLQGALRYLTAAAKGAPADKEIANALKSVQTALKNQSAAAAAAKNVSTKDRLRQLGEEAASAYKAGNFDQAIQNLQEVVTSQPNDASASFGLGKALQAKGDVQQALDYLNKAADLEPSNQLYLSAVREAKQQLRSGAGGGGGDSREQGLKYTPDRRAANSGDDWTEDSAPVAGSSSRRDGVQPFTQQGESMLRKRKRDQSNAYRQAIEDELAPTMGLGDASRLYGGDFNSPTTYTYQYQQVPSYGFSGAPVYGAPIYGGFSPYPSYGGYGYGAPVYRIPRQWGINLYGGNGIGGGFGNVYGGNVYGGNIYGGSAYPGTVYGGSGYPGTIYGGSGLNGGGFGFGGTSGFSPQPTPLGRYRF